MRSFAEWVSSQANSIEDKSEFIKPCSCGTPKPKPIAQTDLQVRAALASLLVPHTNTEGLVQDWLTALCVSLNSVGHGERSLAELFLSQVVGPVKSREYYELKTHEAPIWLMELRRDILEGKTKWE